MSVKLNAPKALPHLHAARMALADAMLDEGGAPVEVATHNGEPVYDYAVSHTALEHIQKASDELWAALDILGENLPPAISEPVQSAADWLNSLNDPTWLMTDFEGDLEAAADDFDDLFDALRDLTPLFTKAEARMGIAEAP